MSSVEHTDPNGEHQVERPCSRRKYELVGIGYQWSQPACVDQVGRGPDELIDRTGRPVDSQHTAGRPDPIADRPSSSTSPQPISTTRMPGAKGNASTISRIRSDSPVIVSSSLKSSRLVENPHRAKH
jgi:hypothetical protein